MVHQVGLVVAQRQQQEEIETMQLVVCSLSGEPRTESLSHNVPKKESLSHNTVRTTEMTKYFGHTRPGWNVRQLDQRAKILQHQQKDGDSPVRMIVPGLLEESRRKIMDGLRLFTAVDGDLEKKRGPKKW